LNMIARYAYTYDGVGNRLERYGVDKNNTYTYDAIYRLLGSITTSPSNQQEAKREVFTYDPVGNRLTSYPGRVYTYNAGNELVKFKDKVYTYDNNGNLAIKTEEDSDEDVEIEGWTYSYDYENRLVKAVKREKDELKTVTFKYDPFGRRMEKRVESVDKGISETRTYGYVYDNEDIIIEYITWGEAGQSWTETIRYTHGLGIDEPLTMEKGGLLYYFHADGLGSITALSDGQGDAVQRYEYDSFGKPIDKSKTIKQPYAFTGRGRSVSFLFCWMLMLVKIIPLSKEREQRNKQI
ncbi:MAG: hypothetical protein NUW09_08525, partial [Deltaproteobacteria bacterium]|nr:hypothetical protein [Deltaproteobacteria bacterium]